MEEARFYGYAVLHVESFLIYRDAMGQKRVVDGFQAAGKVYIPILKMRVCGRFEGRREVALGGYKCCCYFHFDSLMVSVDCRTE
jgi:hypothetical protein